MNAYRRIKDFHGTRKLGVGSSDVPTLVGLNKRYGATALTLWREKTGRAEGFDGNERTEWGNYLEPLILRKFVASRYGEEVAQSFYRNLTRAEPVSTGALKVKTECVHPKYPFALAHTDLLIDRSFPLTDDDPGGASMIVEAKSSGYFAAKRREGLAFEGYDPEDDSQHGIPDKVFLQIQWQLFVYDVPEAIAAVLIDTARYKTYGPVIADPRVQEKLLALAERFWWHVEHDKEPQPSTWDDVVSMTPDLQDTTKFIVQGEEEMKAREMIAEGNRIKAAIKVKENELEEIKMGLGILAGDVEEVEGPGGKKERRFVGTARKYLTTMAGDPLATLSDRRREDLALGAAVTAIKNEQKKKKPAPLTPEQQELLDIDARLRELGMVKVSQWREVRY